MIEPRSVQLQWFHMLVPLASRPQQRMCIRDENHLLKSCYKLHCYKFLVRLTQTM